MSPSVHFVRFGEEFGVFIFPVPAPDRRMQNLWSVNAIPDVSLDLPIRCVRQFDTDHWLFFDSILLSGDVL